VLPPVAQKMSSAQTLRLKKRKRTNLVLFTMEFSDSFAKSLRGLLLLVLIIVTNFLGVTMNCKAQKQLQSSAITRHTALYFMIYFTINLTDSTDSDPTKQWKQTTAIFLLFIVLMKQPPQTFILSLGLLLFVYIQTQVREYHLKHNRQVEAALASTHMQLAIAALIGALTWGFFNYYFKQRQDHAQNFDFSTFLLGNNACETR